MAIDLNPGGEPGPTAGRAASAALHYVDSQRLRILRCTARAMASSPGGLRFKAGTRPWLDGLCSVPAKGNDRRLDAGTQPVAC